MKKITILALHLGYGGIEKCISSLSNSLCEDYEVNIISTYKLYSTPPFYFNSKIKINYLLDDLKPNKEGMFKALKKLKLITFLKILLTNLKTLKLKKKLMIKAIKDCDSNIIISTRDIHNFWLGKYGKKDALKIGWEHNHHNNNKKYIKKIVRSATNLDYFVLVSKELEQFYSEKLKNTNCKTVYIPNTLDYYPDKLSDLTDENITSIGRLSAEKGFQDLIDVFEIVHTAYPNWKLNIIGDGNQKEEIMKKIESKNLSNSIVLHGFQNKDYINRVLDKSSIYVMTSYTESFGIVLLEASSFGIPSIAFDSARGATEIIDNNWDGYLIKDRDKKQMAKKICELISNINRRKVMGLNASKKASNYSTEKIKKQWLKIIEK